MKLEGVCIATARICGLENPPYYHSSKEHFACDITFEDASTLLLKHIPFINLGYNEQEANVRYTKIKETFQQSHISDGDKVAILIGEDGRNLAIGNLGEDTWIDMRDFCQKKFTDFNIVITSLTVY